MREYDEASSTKEYWENRPAYTGRRLTRAESLRAINHPEEFATQDISPEQVEKNMNERIAKMSQEEIEKTLSM